MSLRTGLVAALLSAAAAVGAAAPAPAAVVPVELTARHATVQVAPGVRMEAWTFNGTMPGPTIRVREGDVVQVTLRNAEPPRGHHGRPMWHSVDFHAAQLAPNIGFAGVAPGQEKTFSFVASRPGVFMYHCGTAPMIEHIGMGMYGAIIVEPAAGRPPAHEVTLVQSELYGRVHDRRLHGSAAAMRARRPKYVVFNGRAMRYMSEPIPVPVGEPVRIYLVDAGPSLASAFHVVGTIFDVVQPDGNPANVLTGVSTHLVGAGGGAVFELTFPEPGVYPFVTHAMRDAAAGAMGRFQAG
ncbi:MAG TPA: multicopper oxidase domain-containing protein [Capillimicrobium sp.]|nr:multicopper oxidase domain-containing protein [Capillimicrobium sp.]